MNIIELNLDCYNLIITINYVLLVIFLIIAYAIYKFKSNEISHRSIDLEKFDLGISGLNVTLNYNKKDKEIAYKLWVELSTRKIGLKYDRENDVIEEVYNSWYAFFKISRELLKEMPGTRIQNNVELIQLTSEVLNSGLRPHLTKWQARFRSWFITAKDSDENKYLEPQEIQKKFPKYEELIEDLLKTNKHMIEYMKLMEKIAFDK